MVIGGSRGIGAAIVKRLARDGADVAFTYVSKPERAAELVAAVEGEGGRAFALQADSADASALEQAVAQGTARLGALGKILVIGSNTAERAMAAGSAVYGMTKSAVARLVRGLAWDFAPRGISVINVQPGPTVTDMNPPDGAHIEWVLNAHPEKRFADADEIARFVAYLARPESTYINGASLTIDGGFSA